jgi:hypothetical protein
MRHILLLLVLGTLSLSTCTSDTPQLSKDLSRAIREAAADGVISTTECATLRQQAEAENPDFLLTAANWENTLRDNLPRGVAELTIDCSAKNEKAPATTTGTSCPPTPTMANLYVENSRSMYGYLANGSEFQQVMLDYIVKFDKMDQPFKAAFINNEIFPVDEQAGKYKGAQDIFERKRHFESYLDPRKMDQLGKTGSSKLMEILNAVTDRAVNDCQVQLLVSDYVYSLSGVNNMKSEMTGIQSDMELLIGKVRDAELGTLVIKYRSNFEGRFFPWDSPNRGFAYKGDRPYYVWVFGVPDFLRTFVSKYALEKQAGYEAFALYLPGQKDEPVFGIFPNSGDPHGKFRKSPLKANPVLALSDVAASERRGEEGLRFALGVDLSKYPVTETYARNPDNYHIEGPEEENWRVTEILSLADGLSDRDQRLVGTTQPTHLIMLEADDVESKSSTINVQFRNRKAAWLVRTYTDDDSEAVINEVADRTFGFAYLSDGIWSAYHGPAAEQRFFTIPLTLQR